MADNDTTSTPLVRKTMNRPIISDRFSHYYKKCPYDFVDIYRILQMFEVNDPCLQHALKKLLVAGGRGTKDITKDVQEAIDTLTRWQEMRKEEDVSRGT